MSRTSHTINRAARLRMRATLDLADHAIELLRNKEEAMRREQARLEGHAERTERQWHDHCDNAREWLLRARALGASAEIADLLGERPRAAIITVAWQAAMGVTYPGDVECVPGPPPALATTAALVPTAAAYRSTLVSGAEHAAATAALHRLEAELTNTRRRRRAIEQRLQPTLEAQLHKLDLDLDERDRDAAVRTHLAIRNKGNQP